MDDMGLVECNGIAEVKVEICEISFLRRGTQKVCISSCYLSPYLHLSRKMSNNSQCLSCNWTTTPELSPTGFFKNYLATTNQKNIQQSFRRPRQFLRRSTDLNDRRQVWSTTWRSSAAPGGWRCIQVAVGRQ